MVLLMVYAAWSQLMRKYSEEHSPLRRNATATEVGNMAAFLASEVSSAITGQTIYGAVWVQCL